MTETKGRPTQSKGASNPLAAIIIGRFNQIGQLVPTLKEKIGTQETLEKLFPKITEKGLRNLSLYIAGAGVKLERVQQPNNELVTELKQLYVLFKIDEQPVGMVAFIKGLGVPSKELSTTTIEVLNERYRQVAPIKLFLSRCRLERADQAELGLFDEDDRHQFAMLFAGLGYTARELANLLAARFKEAMKLVEIQWNCPHENELLFLYAFCRSFKP
ncbi:Hypothetical protein POVN_LOCUS341 [uncultured virus]|nr:Hypothetical protein POVN_LOCUS341 [uncultured virus]